MNNEKLLVLFEEVSGLKDALNHAIKTANQLADLNADSKNVTQVIKQFESLSSAADNKIADVNAAAKVFSKNAYVALALAFLAAIMLGGGIGFFNAQKGFIRYLEGNLIKEQMAMIARENLAIQNEWAQIAATKIAKKNGITFFTDGMKMKGSMKAIQKDENGGLIYLYPKP